MVYSEGMSDRTYEELISQGLAAISTNGGVILDATFSSRAKRDYLQTECLKADVAVQVIELEAEKDDVANRLLAREKDAEEISDARLEDLEMLTAAYEPPLERAPDMIRVTTSNLNPEGEVRAALARLAEIQVSKCGRRY